MVCKLEDGIGDSPIPSSHPMALARQCQACRNHFKGEVVLVKDASSTGSICEPVVTLSAPFAIEPPLSLRELTEVLIKHYGLHEGLYELMLEFQIGMGVVGPGPQGSLPGASIGLSKLGLMKVEVVGDNTLDAAVVNPAKKPARKKA